MVFYRKYRPQTISDLDSKEVREKLFAVLSSKNIAHAFLFTGPKGLGKTSAARIVAKSVNCERNFKLKNPQSKIEPCDKCNQCVSISNGSNIDVLEIDGASNRGIDEIRDLREKARLAPAQASKKVYIIDEVHMLTPEAFNALLKTLEEPPNHVMFVLCTTEPQKVPQTIISRCLHISFRKATISELTRSLKRPSIGEKLNIEDEAIELIAKLSDGSFRDGAKILEEIAQVAGRRKITKELVGNNFQITNIKYQVTEMLNMLTLKDTKKALELVDDLVKQGLDMKFFLEQLVGLLHEELLAKVGIAEEGKVSSLTLSQIKDLVGLLSRAHAELKYAILPQLPLELSILEWGSQKAEDTQTNTKSDTKKPGNMHAFGFDSVAGGSKDSHLFSDPKTNLWQAIIEKVKPYNHSVAGLLRGCRLESFSDKNVTIGTGFKFHKEKLEENKTRALLEKVCKELTGKDIRVAVMMKDS